MASMRRITRARHPHFSKKHMKQGVFRKVTVGRREWFETQRRMSHTSSTCPRRCTATVGVLRAKPRISASHKPDCAKLRKLDDPSRTLSRTVRTDHRPSTWPVMHRSRGTKNTRTRKRRNVVANIVSCTWIAVRNTHAQARQSSRDARMHRRVFIRMGCGQPRPLHRCDTVREGSTKGGRERERTDGAQRPARAMAGWRK